MKKCYDTLVQNIPIIIFRLLSDFSLELINHASLPILGFRPQEAMDTTGWFLERICCEDRAKVKELLEHAFLDAEKRSFTAECGLSHRDGHKVYGLIKCISSLECSADRGLGCIEGIIVDITDRVLLEKALMQKEKLQTLGTIAAEVVHEIRNPLVSIGGFARRLQKRFPDAPEADIILRESERLEKMLGRIRDYLRPVEICPQECAVNSLIAECVTLLSPKIQAKHITCRRELNENLPTVLIDPYILTQVFINLVNNAITASPEGGELIIRTYETDRNLHIDFKNHAVDARLKKPELLFLPFDEGGETIGLPLSYRLLKKMGGLLSFTQENDHVIFTVSVSKIRGPTEENQIK